LIIANRKTPASSSALWMITRQTLLGKLQGFSAYKNEVSPEAHMAAQLGKVYGCIISNPTLGVNYEKKWQSQVETSRRLLYPMVGGVWWRGVLGLIVLFLLNMPFFTLLSGFFFGWTEMQVMALWLTAVYMALYGVYTSHVWQGNWWLGGFLWPLVVLQELVLFIQSVRGYARHTITWKGRSVSTGAMRSERIEINQ
jgi:hypothetical protein